MNLQIEFLYFRDCPNQQAARKLLVEVLRENHIKVTLHNMRIDSWDEAVAKRFLGSPTIRINGMDIEPGAETRTDFGMQCRVYLVDGQFNGTPSKHMIQAALQKALTYHPIATTHQNHARRAEEFLPMVCC
ncbi:MAG: DF family (seleno)protein [bacterium]